MTVPAQRQTSRWEAMSALPWLAGQFQASDKHASVACLDMSYSPLFQEQLAHCQTCCVWSNPVINSSDAWSHNTCSALKAGQAPHSASQPNHQHCVALHCCGVLFLSILAAHLSELQRGAPFRILLATGGWVSRSIMYISWRMRCI